MSTDDATGIVADDLDADDPGTDDPDRLPVVELARETGARPRRWMSGRWVVLAAALVVVVGMIVGIVVFNASAPPAGRGAATARAAATDFVRAVDAGDGTRAAGLSCNTFADDARAMARSGRDPGISYRVGSVRVDSETSASATVTETMRMPAGTEQQPVTLSIVRSGGHWQVCGRG